MYDGNLKWSATIPNRVPLFKLNALKLFNTMHLQPKRKLRPQAGILFMRNRKHQNIVQVEIKRFGMHAYPLTHPKEENVFYVVNLNCL